MYISPNTFLLLLILIVIYSSMYLFFKYKVSKMRIKRNKDKKFLIAKYQKELSDKLGRGLTIKEKHDIINIIRSGHDLNDKKLITEQISKYFAKYD